MQKVEVLGTNINICTKTELINQAYKALNQSKVSHHFLSINPIKIIRSEKDSLLSEYIENVGVGIDEDIF